MSFSLPNPIAWLESHVNEQFVLKLIGDIKNDVAVVEADFNNAVSWLVANAPVITSQANLLMQLLGEIGSFNPEVNVAIQSVNVATTALNALAAASKAGETNTQSIVSAYAATKSAVGSTALALASVAAAPVPAVNSVAATMSASTAHTS